MHTHTHAHTHTCIHTHAHTHTCTHTHAHTHTCTHTHMHTHTHAHTHTIAHTHTHAHTHTCTHTHTHIHAHTHTHAHTPLNYIDNYSQWRSYSGAHWSLCPTVSFPGPTVSKCCKSCDLMRDEFSQRYHAEFYMKIIAADILFCYFAITNISGQRKLKFH